MHRRNTYLKKCAFAMILQLAVFFALAAQVLAADGKPPTVSILNPKPGTASTPTIVSLRPSSNDFKVQIQVWDDVTITANTVQVGYYTGATPDSGTFTFVTASLNSNYDCGGNCGVYDAAISGLTPDVDYFLFARASSAEGTGESRQNRTGNNARYIAIRVVAAKAGTGMLLARDSSSQLCLDCHNLPSHSSQAVGVKYENWQAVCLDCHTPHSTRNAYLVKETIITPMSGARVVTLYSMTGDAVNSYVTASLGASTKGICQVCHTRTKNQSTLASRWTNTGNADASHYQSPDTERCTACHKHDQGFQGTGTCLDCHAQAKGTSPVRRATVNEFGGLWGHKKQGRTAITNVDCYPCHMEAMSDGTINTSYHGSGAGNGSIDLRDPDTGSAISLGVDYQFSRNLSSNVISTQVTAIQTFCLKCHDANGASTLGASLQYDPWGAGVTVVDVDSHFATTNASFHPVKGAQNNSYAASANTMETPWDTSEHKLITCFDCHAALNSSGTQTSTVVAHGGDDTLRKSYDANRAANPLCVVCHKSTVYWSAGAMVHALNTDIGTDSQGPGYSALNRTLDDWISYHDLAQTQMRNCTACHGTDLVDGTGTFTPEASRTVRAQNAHGYNELSGGGNWPAITPATAGAPPFAFMRASNNMTSWRPKSWTGQTSPTNGSCDGTNMCGRGENTYTYTPGGAY